MASSRHNNLTFHNWNGERFGWDNDEDEEPLLKDDALESNLPAAPFPDIPARFTGIPRECTTAMPANAPDDASTNEDLAQRVLDNANFGPNMIPSEDAVDDRSGTHRITNNNFFYNIHINNILVSQDLPALVAGEESEDENQEQELTDLNSAEPKAAMETPVMMTATMHVVRKRINRWKIIGVHMTKSKRKCLRGVLGLVMSKRQSTTGTFKGCSQEEIASKPIR